MNEERVKRITLFIMETLYIQDRYNIDEEFAYLFNEFIIKCYQEKNDLLHILYDDMELLQKFIDEGYDILTFKQMYKLLARFGEHNGYIKLIEEVGCETDKKINELVTQFVQYQNDYWSEIQMLYTADPNEYFPKGFSRILQ